MSRAKRFVSRTNTDLLWCIIYSNCDSVEEFADRIGVTPRMIYRAIKKNSCSSAVIKAMTDYFGVDYSFLQNYDKTRL